MSELHDQQFVKTFGLILVGLIIFTIIILMASYVIHRSNTDVEPGPARQAAVEERIRPVAGVYSGETGRAAAQAAAQAAADAEPQLAFDGSTDGAMIYERVCGVCHDIGTADAPRMIAAEMGARLDEQGRDALVETAINGLGAMPPRGGRMDLSDEQVAASVDYMIDQIN